MRLHLDTDFAGDTDDAAALALLLGRDDVEITGVTTVADPDGRRAGYAQRFLRLAGRDHIPVVAGASASLTTGSSMGDLPDHDAYWGGEPVALAQSGAGDAGALLTRSIEQGATVVAIGPYTNLAHCDALCDATVVCMGGWITPPGDGLPQWGADMDWNVQCDTGAAITVLETARELTMVTLAATLVAHIRRSHLARLRAASAVGELLARQAEAHAAEYGVGALARSYPGLPDDLCNFQYDPVAAAVALGWDGVTISEMALRPVLDGAVLRFAPDAAGRAVRVVTDVDGDAFAEMWLRAVENIERVTFVAVPVRYQSPDEDSARWDEFPFRAGDIVISTRSKSGTTWVQMICALLVFQSPDLPAPLGDLSPWLDWLGESRDDVYARLDAQTHRRIVKTHTPLDGIPLDPSATYIVVARHPLDMAVSLYHQGNNLDRARISELTGQPAVAWERPPVHEWLLRWIDADVNPRDAMDSLPGVMGHGADAWARRDDPNVVLVHYADLSADLDGEMRRIAARLGIEVHASSWPALVDAATFAQMRARADTLAPDAAGILKDRTRFFRQGQSGAGRELLSAGELVRYEARAAQLAPPDLLAWLHR